MAQNSYLLRSPDRRKKKHARPSNNRGETGKRSTRRGRTPGAAKIKMNRQKPKSKKGFVHVYTGEGKGKTCAALGMIVRATGAGMRIYVGQFLKRGETCELKTLAERFPNVVVETFGSGKWIKGQPTAADAAAARSGLRRLRAAARSGRYSMVVADEATLAVHYNMISAEALVRLADEKAQNVELIITGRNAPPQLIRRAELVTEMRCVKHYHSCGVKARKGVEF